MDIYIYIYIYIYDFSVNFEAIANDKDIHKYLVEKNNIK